MKTLNLFGILYLCPKGGQSVGEKKFRRRVWWAI